MPRATLDEIADALFRSYERGRHARLHPSAALRVATALKRSQAQVDRDDIAMAICGAKKKCAERCPSCTMTANSVMQVLEGKKSLAE